MSKTDLVNQPPHYKAGATERSRPALLALGFDKDQFQEECIVAILNLIGPRAFFWGCYMTVISYLWRAGYKGDASTDYAKARWYAQRGLKDGLAAQMWRFRLEDALKEIPNDAD